MVFLIGVGLLVTGVIGAVIAFGTMDSGPEWLSAIAGLASWLTVPGIILTLVGLGIWLGHPHVIHIHF